MTAAARTSASNQTKPEGNNTPGPLETETHGPVYPKGVPAALLVAGPFAQSGLAAMAVATSTN